MATKLQLHMWSRERQEIIEQHDFYVEQLKDRLFSQFADIEGEARRHRQTLYASQLADAAAVGQEGDTETAAEIAQHRAEVLYDSLYEMKQAMMLGALAGLYHRWDKTLRDFIERELRHNMKSAAATRFAWHPNSGYPLDILQEFGCVSQSAAFYPKINACRLVVNIYKHGKGRSLDDLVSLYPVYLTSATEGLPASFVEEDPDYRWVEVSEPQFQDIADALRKFREDMPERLWLEPSRPAPESAR